MTDITADCSDKCKVHRVCTFQPSEAGDLQFWVQLSFGWALQSVLIACCRMNDLLQWAQAVESTMDKDE
eukprot:4089457-Amphidinium_carterae.1